MGLLQVTTSPEGVVSAIAHCAQDHLTLTLPGPGVWSREPTTPSQVLTGEDASLVVDVTNVRIPMATYFRFADCAEKTMWTFNVDSSPRVIVLPGQCLQLKHESKVSGDNCGSTSTVEFTVKLLADFCRERPTSKECYGRKPEPSTTPSSSSMPPRALTTDVLSGSGSSSAAAGTVPPPSAAADEIQIPAASPQTPTATPKSAALKSTSTWRLGVVFSFLWVATELVMARAF